MVEVWVVEVWVVEVCFPVGQSLIRVDSCDLSFSAWMDVSWPQKHEVIRTQKAQRTFSQTTNAVVTSSDLEHR